MRIYSRHSLAHAHGAGEGTARELALARRADFDPCPASDTLQTTTETSLHLSAERREPCCYELESSVELLLEGSWPEIEECNERHALDDAIDGRFEAIDAEAQRMAAEISAKQGWSLASPDGATAVSLAELNGLRLRYELVKLLRMETYFRDVRPLTPGDRVYFRGEAGRDDDYAACLTVICESAGASLHVDFVPATRLAPPKNEKRESAWRRWAAKVVSVLPRPSGTEPTVVFCGNRNLLGPVCQELIDRGCRVAWLYEQFAFGCWRSFGRKVEQWLCPGTSGEGWAARNLLPLPLGEDWGEGFEEQSQGARRDLENTALTPTLSRSTGRGRTVWHASILLWVQRTAAQYAPPQSRWLARLDEHFSGGRPAALVLDEDVTPFAKAAVAIARRHGVPSLVVQHGAPYGPFGFAPLSADRLLAWGETSRQRFVEFGIPYNNIEVVGSPRLAADQASLARNGSRRILFLATNPPADSRPDAVAFHLTGRSHRELLRRLCRGAQRQGNVELVIKLHPRCRQTEVFHEVAAEFPRLRCRIVQGGRLADWLRDSHCVVSCGSSAGIEATLWRRPVIELLDGASAELLPAKAWGLWGVARSDEELDELLKTALSADMAALPEGNPSVLARQGRAAASACADTILRAIVDGSQPHSRRAGGVSPSAKKPDRGWRGLAHDLALVGGSTIVCQVLGIVTSLLLRAILDPAQIGLWQGLRLWLGVSNHANLGAGKAAARDLSISLGSNNAGPAARSLSLANAVNLVASGLFAALLAAGACWRALSSSAGWRDGWAMGLILVAVLALLQRHVTFRVTLLRSRRNFHLATRLSLLEGGLTLVLSAAAAWAWGVPGLCVAALAVMLASWVVLRRCDETTLGLAWNTREIGRLLAIGGPLMLAGLAATLFTSLDKWLILALLPDGEYQLGCYSLALLVTAQVMGAGSAVSIVAGPRYAQLYGRTSCRRQVALLTAEVSELHALLLGAICGLAVLAGGPLLAWLLPKYEPGLAPLAWLMPGALAASLSAPLAQYQAAVADGRRMLTPLIAGLVVAGLGVTGALCLGWGLIGAAAAMTVAQVVCLAGSLSLSIWPELTAGERLRYLALVAWGFVPTLLAGILPNAAGLTAWLAWCGLSAWLSRRAWVSIATSEATHAAQRGAFAALRPPAPAPHLSARSPLKSEH